MNTDALQSLFGRRVRELRRGEGYTQEELAEAAALSAYYEGIVGECISLQDRFPMAVHGYVYLHPLTSIKKGKEGESIDHARYARMYEAITGRSGPGYKSLRGLYGQFAYMVVDFEEDPPALRDDVVRGAVGDTDLFIGTFVDRVIDTFNDRMLFWDVLE